MRLRPPLATAAALGAAVLAAPAMAQLSSSPGFQLDGLALDGAGSGTCSIGHAAIVGQPSIAPDGSLSSTGFGAELGFLTLFDPLNTDQPAIFAVDPAFGPNAGGTSVTLCGIHLDRAGAAGTVVATLDGAPLTGLSVLSDSTASATVPASPNGPLDLDVTTNLGAATVPGGFVATPAVTVSPRAYQTGELEIVNYGPLGAVFDLYASPFTTNIPIAPYGTLLIGPAPLIPLIAFQPYPAPDGVFVTRATIPVDAVLAGLTLHFQSIAVISFAPLEIALLNRATTELQ